MAFNGDDSGGPFANTYYFDVMNYAGTDVISSGSHSGTLTGAIAAAKAAVGDAAAWFIVVRDWNGSTVHSEGSDANAGQGKEPPAQGEGGSTEAGGGTGEAGVLAWRYRLTKNGQDTATSGYTYPTRESARDAADALVPPLASRTDDYSIIVEANISGWEPSVYSRPKNVNDSTNPENPNQPPTGEPPILPLPPGDGTVTKPVSIASWDNEIAIAATVAIGAAIVYAGYVLISKAVK